MSTIATRTSTLIRRAHRIWAEMDYAQRRSFEIQTGIRSVSRRHPQIARGVAELESLYMHGRRV